MSSLLTRIGLPWLWGANVESAWVVMRFNVVPLTTRVCAPGSCCYGLERLPARGGGVVAINHLSAIDAPLVGSFSNRAIWYMVKSELMEIPVLGEAFGWAGGFSIRRGESDREGLRQARELVRAGHLVGVFVEGTRQRFGYPGDVHAGALSVALKEGVPIIPCAVESFGWGWRNRRACCVVWGNPIDLSGFSSNGTGCRAAAEVTRLEILSLWRQAAEAVSAGYPPVLPDGTARQTWPRAHEFRRAQTIRRPSGRVSSPG